MRRILSLIGQNSRLFERNLYMGETNCLPYVTPTKKQPLHMQGMVAICRYRAWQNFA
jgi:hypothetical protein